jgi:hypothetical protein
MFAISNCFYVVKGTSRNTAIMFSKYYQTIKVLSKVLALLTTPFMAKSVLDKGIRGF